MGKKNKKKNKKQKRPAEENTSLKAVGEKRAKTTSNPLLEQQQAFLATLSEMERSAFFSEDVSPDRRSELWMQQADLGEGLVDEFSWATPDARALRILRNLALPLIEIGCGANAYWCRQLQAAGIDILGFDVNPTQGGKITKEDSDDVDFTVLQGGPQVLADPKHAHRTLFLCYPDENEHEELQDEDSEPTSLGSACLQYYTGDTLVHVGELFGDNWCLPQAPWGRSSSPDFQQSLAADFHCVLRVELPNWLHVQDCLTVWKRSPTCTLVFAGEEEEDDDADEEVVYKHVPVSERLPMDIAAPAFEHLLEKKNSDVQAQESQQAKTNKRNRPPSSASPAAKKKHAAESNSSADKRYECPW